MMLQIIDCLGLQREKEWESEREREREKEREQKYTDKRNVKSREEGDRTQMHCIPNSHPRGLWVFDSWVLLSSRAEGPGQSKPRRAPGNAIKTSGPFPGLHGTVAQIIYASTTARGEIEKERERERENERETVSLPVFNGHFSSAAQWPLRGVHHRRRHHKA